MRALTRTRAEMEGAWQAFVADGHLDARVRPEIRRSWERVRRDGQVEPGLSASPRVLTADDVLARAEAEEAFRAASPVVTEFAGRLACDGHVVGYFDAGGVMLALEGNHRSRDRLGDVNFVPGACWAESAAGTNGPGTALAEAAPVEVFASEHFVEAWHPWTCASAPVRCLGRVVGVVDITSPWEQHSCALLLTAEALARAIEARLDAAAARRASAVLADAAHGMHEEFLAVAAHELRTPLTPLRLNIQRLRRLAERAAAPLDPVHLADALRRADREVGRVVETLDSLLESPPS